MKTAKLFVAKGCPHCADAKRKIEQLKKEGKCCYNFKFIDVEESPQLSKDIRAVPMVQIGKKMLYFEDAIKMCPVGGK